MDVSTFLKKLKKSMSAKTKSEENEQEHCINSESGAKESDTNNAIESNNAREVYTFSKEYKDSHRDRDIDSSSIDESDESDNDAVFFATSVDETTNQQRRRKSKFNNIHHKGSNYNNHNNLFNVIAPTTLNEINYYDIPKDLPMLNVARTNTQEQSATTRIRRHSTTTATTLTTSSSSSSLLKEKRHTLLAAMKAKAQQDNNNTLHKRARHDLTSNIENIETNTCDNKRRSDDDDDNNKFRTNNKDNAISDIVRDRQKDDELYEVCEETYHKLQKKRYGYDTVKHNDNKDNINNNKKFNNHINISTSEVSMVDVDELLAGVDDATLPIDLNFTDINRNVIIDSDKINNEIIDKSTLSVIDTDNNEDSIGNLQNNTTDITDTGKEDKNTVSGATIEDSSIQHAVESSDTAKATLTSAISPPVPMQMKKLNAFARAKLIAQRNLGLASTAEDDNSNGVLQMQLNQQEQQNVQGLRIQRF